MSDYTNFPPFKYFLRVLKTCPKSALLYTQLWKKRGKNLSFHVIKKDIRREFLMSPTLFRNLLSPLMFMNLISFKENDVQYHVDILGQHIDE